MLTTGQKAALGLATGPLGLATASASYQRIAEHRDRQQFSPPGELVDIGGRRLHVIRSGTADPVVVVLPALGTPAVEWVRVQRILAEQTDATIIAVDRGGIGWSDPRPGRARQPRWPKNWTP